MPLWKMQANLERSDSARLDGNIRSIVGRGAGDTASSTKPSAPAPRPPTCSTGNLVGKAVNILVSPFQAAAKMQPPQSEPSTQASSEDGSAHRGTASRLKSSDSANSVSASPPVLRRLSTRSSAEALARYSCIRRSSVQSALTAISHFNELRDSAGPAFIDVEHLTKVKDLGRGAFATVEHCRLSCRPDSLDCSMPTPPQGTATASSNYGGSHVSRNDHNCCYSSGGDAAAEAAPAAAVGADAVDGSGSGGGSGLRARFAVPQAAAAATSAANARPPARTTTKTTTVANGSAAADEQPTVMDVAVKRLRSELFVSTGDMADFVKEASVLADLSHPTIVGVLGVGFAAEGDSADGGDVSEASMFMVTELCTGGSLREKVLSQVLKPRKVVYTYSEGLKWCIQLAEGLAFLHAQQPMLIHRDVKLDNALLSEAPDGTWNAKLADFGLHACVDARERSYTAALNHSQLAIKLEALAANGAADGGATADSAFSIASCACTAEGAGGAEAGAHKPCAACSSQHSGSRHGRLGGIAHQKAQGVMSRVKSLVRSRGSSGTGRRLFHLTGQTGSYLGMAPEVTMNRPYNEKVDIFSLGCVIYDVMGKRLTATEVSYTGELRELQTYAMRVAYGYRRPHPLNWPPELAQLVADCQAQKASLRPSAVQVVQRLQQLAASDGIAAMDRRRRGCGCLG